MARPQPQEVFIPLAVAFPGNAKCYRIFMPGYVNAP